MTLTTNQGGIFTGTGNNVLLNLVSGVDWIRVRNLTQAAAGQTTALEVEFYWQVGMAQNSQYAYLKSNAAAAANLIQYEVVGGFSYYNSTVPSIGALTSTITAISAAAIPVVTNTGTNGLVAGDIVRLVNIVGGQQLGGIDFEVGNNTLSTTTFSLDYMAQIVAATTGSFRKVNFNSIFYPRRRVITKITKAAQAVITLSVSHGYEVGQSIRLRVPAAFGMVEMDNLLATIVAIDTTPTTGNSITVDIDSTAFTTFAWPLTATFAAFSPAETIPVGEDTAAALVAGVDILSDATQNTGQIGMNLKGGAGFPGGANADVMIWEAGTFFDSNSNPNV